MQCLHNTISFVTNWYKSVQKKPKALILNEFSHQFRQHLKFYESFFFIFFWLKWVENESFFYIFHEHLIWSFLGNVSTTKANKTFSMFLISMGLFWLWSWNCKVLNGNFVLFYLKSYSTLLYKLFGLNEDFFFFFWERNEEIQRVFYKSV